MIYMIIWQFRYENYKCRKYYYKWLLEINLLSALSTVPRFSATSSFEYAVFLLENHLDTFRTLVTWAEWKSLLLYKTNFWEIIKMQAYFLISYFKETQKTVYRKLRHYYNNFNLTHSSISTKMWFYLRKKMFFAKKINVWTPLQTQQYFKHKNLLVITFEIFIFETPTLIALPFELV